MKKYISGDYAFFDDEKELYYCYVGFNNPKMSLELSVYGNTPQVAKQKAAALVTLLNNHPEGNIMDNTQEINKRYERLLAKLKEDPQFDLKVEYGQLLMMPFDSFTPDQKRRYYELAELLKEKP